MLGFRAREALEHVDDLDLVVLVTRLQEVDAPHKGEVVLDLVLEDRRGAEFKSC